MLARIYQPVGEDLKRVDERIAGLAGVSPPHLAELLRHSLAAGGKRVRPALVLLAGSLHEYRRERLLPMAVAIEVLHTATLVHDDAIDHSPRRRSHPTVNEVWGEARAILLGDYLLAQAEDIVADTGDLEVVKLFARTIMTIARGELGQAGGAFDIEQTEAGYFERIAGKTASLIVLATTAGAVLSEAPPQAAAALKDYGYNLGIAFQMVDDILDFTGDPAEMGKPTGSDLSEGTLTLPAMLTLSRGGDENPVRRLFRGEGEKRENISRAVELVLASGAIEECYRRAEGYRDRALQSLELLPDRPARDSLRALAGYVVARRH